MLSLINIERKTLTPEILVLAIIIFSLSLLALLQLTPTEELFKSGLEADLSTNVSINQENRSDFDNMARRLPQAIIIGSRKCGTRALLKFLELNPSVRAAHREVHFFDKPHHYKLSFDWYRSQMPESRPHEVTIEKSPAYFVTREVAERIKSMNSSIKLVLILRDPVTRLISDFSQLIANKIAASGDYEDGDYGMNGDEHYPEYYTANHSAKSMWDKAEEEFQSYVLRPDGGIDDQRKAVKTGMYSVYLERWRALFPLEQFHFVDGETLVGDPHKELHKLELFLGLKPAIRHSDFVFNQKKGFFCIAKKSIEHEGQAGSFGYNNALQRSNDTSEATCLSRSKGRRHVTVGEDLIKKLQKFYAPYNEYLYSLTGRRFNWSAM